MKLTPGQRKKLAESTMADLFLGCLDEILDDVKNIENMREGELEGRREASIIITSHRQAITILRDGGEVVDPPYESYE